MTVYAPELSYTVAISWQTPSVTDNSGESISPQQVAGPAKGTSVGEGVYHILYTASDSAGNSATCTFSITIQGKHMHTTRSYRRFKWNCNLLSGLVIVVFFRHCFFHLYFFQPLIPNHHYFLPAFLPLPSPIYHSKEFAERKLYSHTSFTQMVKYVQYPLLFMLTMNLNYFINHHLHSPCSHIMSFMPWSNFKWIIGISVTDYINQRGNHNFVTVWTIFLSPVVTCSALSAQWPLAVNCPDGVVNGASCSFSCDTGYRLVGYQVTSCHRNGYTASWSNDPPTCSGKRQHLD